MPVPSSISDLSTTPSLNSPAGTESPSTVDDYLRTFAAFIKQVDGSAVKAADLAAPGGSALVGYDGGTAQDVLDEAKPMANYTALRAYTGRATGVRITQTGLAGFFQRDDADTTSADNGGTIIVDASGRRWKRLFSGALNVGWFGLTAGGAVENVTAVQAAIDTGHPRLEYPGGTYNLTGAVLKSNQSHIANGTVLTSTGSIFVPQGNASNVGVYGFTFAGTGKAIDQPDESFYSVSFHIKNNKFAKSLSECVYFTPINSVIEENIFGFNLGAVGAQHRHLVMRGKPTGLTAANANVIRKNYFTAAAGATESTYLYYGTGNEFSQNIWEENGIRPVRVNGGGVTKFDNNFLESNDSAHQIRFESDGTVTSTIYYNRVISATNNTFNLLKTGNAYIFSLDANSLNLALTRNQYYTNQAGVYVTTASTGDNGGVAEFGRNSNYAASLNETGLFNFSALNVSGKTVLGGTTAADATLVVKQIGSNTPLRVVNASDANLFYVGGTGQFNTGVAADSPYNSTTASAANMVVLSNGVIQRSTSALKYKTDVRDIERIDISTFRPVRYKSKCDSDDKTRDHFGVIADEVHEAGVTELVNYGADGAVEGFAYERLTVVLLKELQALRSEFEAYKAERPL